MTDTRDQASSCPLLAPDSPVLYCDGVVLRAQLHGPGVVVVTVTGDIDPSNSDSVSRYVHRLVAEGNPVILDLSDVGFLSVQGLRALLSLADDGAKTGMQWAVVAGARVIRLLSLLGHGNSIPTVSTLTEAERRF